MAKQPGRYSADIERLQREAQADGFPISVDGIDGPETKAALEKYREAKAEKQRQDAERNRANAAAQKAASDAEAKRAEAEAERVRAETERARIEGENKRRSDEAEEAARVRDAAAAKATKDAVMTTVAIAAGIGLGHVSAAGIAAKDKKAVSARNRELAKVGNQAEAALDTLAKSKVSKGAAKSATSRVEGAVAAADKLDPKGIKGAARLAGRVGALRGVSFIAEGLALRTIVSDKVADENTKQILQEVGTGLMLAGSGTIAESATNVATAAPVSGKAAGQIEAARSFASAKDGGATSKAAAKQALKLNAANVPTAVAAAETGMAKAVKSIAKKVLPWAGLVAGVVAVARSAQAGGVSDALKTAGELVDPTNGAAARLINSGAEEGDSPLKALAKHQAQERQKKTGVAEIAAQVQGGNGGREAPGIGPDLELPKTSDIARGMVERGTADPRQAALMAAVGAQGLDNYYAGFRPPEMLAREPHQELAANAAREVSARKEIVMSDPSRMAPAPQMPTPVEHRPHHVWDDNARAAAAEARRQKRGY